MKINITRNYGFVTNKRIAIQQKKIADIARGIGYLEFGIFNYDVKSDSEGDLDKRIAGITAAIEKADITFIQLPTGNGVNFDEKLIRNIHERESKVVLLWHSIGYYEKNKYILSIWADYDVIPRETYEALELSDFSCKKLLVNASYNALRTFKDTEQTIHIGMGVHDRDGNYSSWLGVTMQSIVDNTNAHVHFHILHDDTLSEVNKQRLRYIARNSNNTISFHLICSEIFENGAEQMGGYTVGALFRVLLPDVCIDIDRIIYLDSDLLINCDIKELWETNIDNYCLAAVPDLGVADGTMWALPVDEGVIDRKTYFNSGVIYMNLKKIRQMGNMKHSVMEYIVSHPSSNLPDQDALNVIYNAHTFLLDEKWNRFVRNVRKCANNELQEGIYHYVGNLCVLYFKSKVDLKYFEVAHRTPWSQYLTNLYIEWSFGRLMMRIKNLESLLYQIARCNKRYVFYGEETESMKNIYKLLGVSENSNYRVLQVPDQRGILPCRELNYLENQNDEVMVLVLPQADNGTAIANLEKLGFEYEKNFWTIPNILNYFDGGYLV